MLNLFLADFYITHHCNLNCERCNRFNNYNLRGHRDWRPYQEDYARWAANTNIEWINVLGGEPLMHPDVLGWLRQLRAWWPRSTMSIMTNGTMLNQVKGLYDTARDTDCLIDVCVHNSAWHDRVRSDLDIFFPDGFTIEEPPDPIFHRRIAQDRHGVRVQIKHSTWMHHSAVLLDHDRLRVHHSDPVKAHAVCQNSRCHHFIDGRVYKCGVPLLISELAERYHMDLDDKDRELVQQPGGFSIDRALADPDAFYHYLGNEIDHCRLCPENLDFQHIQAEIGKTVIPIQLRR